MNVLDEFHRDEQRLLDRLVDGELGQEERRELLASLDDEPGAWRRCALAFLEAQTWCWQLSQLAGEPILAQASSGPVAVGTSPSTGRTTSFWGKYLAIAAGLIVAFGLGTRFQAPGTLPPGASSAAVAQAAEDDSDPDVFESADDFDSDAPETLTLAAGDEADPFELQVVNASEDDQDFMADQVSAIPADFLLELKQAGLEVTSEKRLWPIDLSDGRRLIVPVEQIEIRSSQFVQYQ